MQMINALVAEGQAASSNLAADSGLGDLLAQLGAPVDLHAMEEDTPPSTGHAQGKGRKQKKGKSKKPAKSQRVGGKGASGGGNAAAPEPASDTFAWSEFQSAAPDAAAIAAPAFDFDDSDDDDQAAGTPVGGQALLASLMAGGGGAAAHPPHFHPKSP